MKICEKIEDLDIITNNPVDNTKIFIKKLYNAGFPPLLFYETHFLAEGDNLIRVLYSKQFDPLSPQLYLAPPPIENNPFPSPSPIIIIPSNSPSFVSLSPYLLSPEIIELLKLKLVIHTILCCVELPQDYIENRELPLDEVVVSALPNNLHISINNTNDFFKTFVQSLEKAHNTKCLREIISVIANYFFSLKKMTEQAFPSPLSLTVSYLINILPPPLPPAKIEVGYFHKQTTTGIVSFLKKETSKNLGRATNVEALLPNLQMDVLGLCKEQRKNGFFF